MLLIVLLMIQKCKQNPVRIIFAVAFLMACDKTASLKLAIPLKIFSQAYSFPYPEVIPCSVFAFTYASLIINAVSKNIFILLIPRMVCFSNLKSRSILPFIRSIPLLFRYSLFHFLLFLATRVKILLSVFNGIRKILLS